MATATVDREPLRRFALDFLTANLSRCRVRRELLDRLQRLCRCATTTDRVDVAWSDLLAVCQALMPRNGHSSGVAQHSAQAVGLELLGAAQANESEGEEEEAGPQGSELTLGSHPAPAVFRSESAE